MTRRSDIHLSMSILAEQRAAWEALMLTRLAALPPVNDGDDPDTLRIDALANTTPFDADAELQEDQHAREIIPDPADVDDFEHLNPEDGDNA